MYEFKSIYFMCFSSSYKPSWLSLHDHFFIWVCSKWISKSLIKWLGEKEDIQTNQASQKYFKYFSIGIINMIYVQTHTHAFCMSLCRADQHLDRFLMKPWLAKFDWLRVCMSRSEFRWFRLRREFPFTPGALPQCY